MNPTATNLTQVQPAKSPSATARQQSAPAPDVAFSQVLSGEIEHNRNSAQAREVSRKEADSKTGESNAAIASADSTKTDTTAATQATETDVPRSETSPTEAVALLPDAQNLPGTPDALLALAMQLNLLKSAPAGKNSAPTEMTTDSDAGTTLFDSRKGAARPPWLATQAADATVGAGKIDASLTGQAEVRATQANTAPSGSVAAAFSGQLAAARQSDAMKTGERLPDILSNPSLAISTQVSVDAAAPLSNGAASTLAPSVGTTAWSQALGDKIVWMAAGAQQTATLTLNPPNLGPLQIVLNLTNDQATANFFTAQPEVRQALETAFPRLREMMSEVGIQLGQASVSTETPGQHASPERQAQWTAMPFIGTNDTPGSPAVPIALRQSGRGLVDTFA